MRDVAQMTWALGVLEQPELPFIAACQHAAGRRMAQASVVDVINLMWGYARLGVPLSGPCMQMHTVSPSLTSWQVQRCCCASVATPTSCLSLV